MLKLNIVNCLYFISEVKISVNKKCKDGVFEQDGVKKILDNMYDKTYIVNIKVIRRTVQYIKWFKKLRDKKAKAQIYSRMIRLAAGNSGDSRFLGDISELRIDYGPGYRVYYKDTGKEIIILLCGGDKSTQEADIRRARIIADNYIFDDEEEK